MRLTSRDCRRNRRREARETRKTSGEIPSPTAASFQLIRAVTMIMETSVNAELMKGMTPSTAMFWTDVASY